MQTEHWTETYQCTAFRVPGTGFPGNKKGKLTLSASLFYFEIGVWY